MCGIGGFVTQKPVPDIGARLGKVAGTLAHRGPDGTGYWQNETQTVGLTHTRLAIVDLSADANQPMVAGSGLPIIVYNGEIYNWRAIRADLEQLGHIFHTQSDTEVLLQGYLQWGADVLDHLRGMFAFAIWDPRDESLFCARDPVGKKPFVFAQSDKGFVFASEIPAVLQMLDLTGLQRKFNHSAIAAMMLHNIRHIPDPVTAYQGVERLRAGHAMIIKNGEMVRHWRYWDPMAKSASVDSPAGAEAVRLVLEEAIDLRRIADVPVGGLLSGGVDSSAILSLAQRHTQEPIRTYALGLDADDEDLRRARFMADRIGTHHKEYYFDAQAEWDGFKSILETHGEPIMLLPLVHTLELCRSIREDGIKVVLSGNGADELFYGYTGMVQTGRLSSAVSMLEFLSPLLRLAPGSAHLPRPLQVLSAKRGKRKAALYGGYANNTWPDLLTQQARDEISNIASAELAYWGEIGPHEDYIDESSFCGLMVENTHSVTIAADLPAMMAGVEMRAPFLDTEMVSLALKTSWREKLPRNGDPTRLKNILRKAVSDLLPDEILHAPKRGFGMGIAQATVLRSIWSGYGDALFKDPHDAGGLFDGAALRGLWKDFLSGDNGNADVVLKLFAVQQWLQSTRSAA